MTRVKEEKEETRGLAKLELSQFRLKAMKQDTQ